MISVEHIEGWRGQTVLDPGGEQLGKLEEIYLDKSTGTPLLIDGQERAAGTPFEARPDRRRERLARLRARRARQGDRRRRARGDRRRRPDAAALDAVGVAYGLRFSERVKLESSAEAEARRAEAEAARARADELAREARDKIEARDAAHDRAHGASEDATQAEREAEEARQAALDAREKAQRYDDE